MRLIDLLPAAADALNDAGQRLGDRLTPTFRLGVTGLSRSGKTVFITALVRALTTGATLPALEAAALGRFAGAWLEPQPDDHLPRFDYESHLACLGADPPVWPAGTRAISQLRLTLAYTHANAWLAAILPGRLHVDIVDYPGEWLVDLAMLGDDFAAWSVDALALARAPHRLPAAAPFLAYLETLDRANPDTEAAAITGARLFTAYLLQARGHEGSGGTLGPGRFLLPGDLGGSPLLTFFPLPSAPDPSARRGALPAMLERRYESYKAHIVRPFFRDHFARLDRQVVLVDVLGALDAGGPALTELERGLDAVMHALRPRAGSWLDLLTGRRLDKVLFAATKADHLHHSSHDRLEAILSLLCERAATRTHAAGATVGAMAIAALRATHEAVSDPGSQSLPCIVGVPLPGEKLGPRTFDGRDATALFPGDLPADPEAALSSAERAADDVRFLRFRPPRLALDDRGGIVPPAPHIGLDRALQFLLGDRLT